MVIHEAHLAGRPTSLEVGTASRRGEGANLPWEAHCPGGKSSPRFCSPLFSRWTPFPLLVWVALLRGWAGAGGSLNRRVLGHL